MEDFLRDYQYEAVERMKNGCILNGSVGSGKSRTALYYYYTQNGGIIKGGINKPMQNPKDLYIITTARKRDTLEWDMELSEFALSKHPDCNFYKNKVTIDSWNNIKKYVGVENAFIIFDEDRVIGSGAWVKAFLKITKANDWIILSATPADTWADYIPVFIANGFYKNRTQFYNEHVVWNSFTNFRKIDRYVGTGRLIRLRRNILVDMDFHKQTIPHHEYVTVSYDQANYRMAMKNRWNPFTDEPIENPSQLCYTLRRIVNTDNSRIFAVLDLVHKKNKAIIFYNYDYELEILRGLNYGEEFEIAEWNGHKHQELPTGEKWVYLVQYTAGCEGWNCINTDTIIFYSENYSYKVMTQAAGRIDRLNTPYIDLYYYHMTTKSSIDLAIMRALKEKKKFNEGKFYGNYI